jgi:hypothetical protein
LNRWAPRNVVLMSVPLCVRFSPVFLFLLLFLTAHAPPRSLLSLSQPFINLTPVFYICKRFKPIW